MSAPEYAIVLAATPSDAYGPMSWERMTTFIAAHPNQSYQFYLLLTPDLPAGTKL